MKTEESEKLDDAIASTIDVLRGFEPGKHRATLTDAESIAIAMRMLDTALHEYREAIRHY